MKTRSEAESPARKLKELTGGGMGDYNEGG